MLPWVLLAVAAGATHPAGPAEVAFVTTDFLGVRAAPEAGATVLGRLAITAPVRVVERKEGWTKVETAGLGGWVATEHLGPAKLDLTQAKKAAKRARGRERVEWLERVVALAPADREAWGELAEAARAAKLKDKERHARDVLAGRLTVYVLACGRVVLGIAGDGSATEPSAQGLLPEEGAAEEESPELKPLESLARDLAGATWWPVDGTPESRALASAPRVAREETCASEWRAEIRIGEASCQVTLPRIEEALVSAFPGVVAPGGAGDPPPEGDLERAIRKSGVRPDDVGAPEPFGDGTRWAVSYRGRVEAEDGEGPMTITSWAAFDAGGAMDPEVRVEFVARGGDEMELGEAAWFRLGEVHVGLRPWAVEVTVAVPGEEGTTQVRASGLWYLIAGPGGARAGEIVLARDGPEC